MYKYKAIASGIHNNIGEVAFREELLKALMIAYPNCHLAYERVEKNDDVIYYHVSDRPLASDELQFLITYRVWLVKE